MEREGGREWGERKFILWTAILTHCRTCRHFFELVRFDFVIDEDLGVWLMEVNLSPNLSSDHFHENRFMYEQVSIQYFILSLVLSLSQRF
jgi:hypothetical protein